MNADIIHMAVEQPSKRRRRPADDEADTPSKLTTTKKLSNKQTQALLKRHGIRIDGLPLDNSGHAERVFRLIHEHGRSVGLCTDATGGGRWMLFDPQTGLWSERGAKFLLMGFVRRVGELLLEWSDQLDAKIRAGLVREEDAAPVAALCGSLHVQGTNLRNSQSSVITVAQGFDTHHIHDNEFDRTPDHILVGNGVVDLRTATLSPHDPQWKFTRRIAVNYDPDAPAPYFHEFLEHIFPDSELRPWMQLSAGYKLTGHNTEQCLEIYTGPTETGKSTFVSCLAATMGRINDDGYSRPAPRGLFRPDQAHWGDTATLQDARLVYDSEMSEGTTIDSALIRMLTGEDELTANEKYGRHKTFKLTGKFVLMTNGLPAFNQKDSSDEIAATMRRIFVVPMNQRLRDKYPTPEALRELHQALANEQAGILAWMIEGARQWYQTSLHTDVPAAIREATDAYAIRINAFDPIGTPLTDAGYIITHGPEFTPTTELHAAVKEWHLRHRKPVPDIKLVAEWCQQHGLKGPKQTRVRTTAHDGSSKLAIKRGFHGIGRS